MFPAEALPNILSFLDEESLFRGAQGVSRGWYHATTNTGILNLSVHRTGDGLDFYDIMWAIVEARCTATSGDETVNESEGEESDQKPAATPPKRTRGHLPEPPMDFWEDADTTKSGTQVMLEAASKYPGDACKIEFSKLMCCTGGISSSQVESLDFPELAWMFVTRPMNRISWPTHVPLAHRPVRRTVISPLKKPDSYLHAHLQRINASHFNTNLMQVSVRGCKHLADIALAPTVLGLDAKSCTKLQQILIPVIRKEEEEENNNMDTKPAAVGGSDDPKNVTPSPLSSCQLQSLNLYGCRSLTTIGGPTWSSSGNLLRQGLACNLRHVDLSSCERLAPTDVANLSRATHCLETLSLRYIATDVIVQALAESISASTGCLTMVDVAFSKTITDVSVNQLVANALSLTRLNLRGCRKISSHCYNRTPLVLQQRQNSNIGETTAMAGMDQNNDEDTTASGVARLPERGSNDDDNHCQSATSRKGDNLFALMSSYEEQQQGKKPKARKRQKT